MGICILGKFGKFGICRSLGFGIVCIEGVLLWGLWSIRLGILGNMFHWSDYMVYTQTNNTHYYIPYTHSPYTTYTAYPNISHNLD